jgi:hypothetical protein
MALTPPVFRAGIFDGKFGESGADKPPGPEFSAEFSALSSCADN